MLCYIMLCYVMLCYVMLCILMLLSYTYCSTLVIENLGQSWNMILFVVRIILRWWVIHGKIMGSYNYYETDTHPQDSTDEWKKSVLPHGKFGSIPQLQTWPRNPRIGLDVVLTLGAESFPIEVITSSLVLLGRIHGITWQNPCLALGIQHFNQICFDFDEDLSNFCHRFFLARPTFKLHTSTVMN